MDGKDFWKRIDNLLDEQNRTLKDMTDSIHLNYQTLSMQRIRKTLPKIEQLIDMSVYFGITLDELMTATKNLSRRAIRIAEESDQAREEILFCIELLLGIKKEEEKSATQLPSSNVRQDETHNNHLTR